MRSALKQLGRSRLVQEIAGSLLAAYLRLAGRTTRFVMEPDGFVDAIGPQLPVIAAMWHGQHFMMHHAWPTGARVAALISRHGDGEINAVVLRRLGVIPIRGSGGRAGRMHRKGAFAATREMLRALASGETLVLTADVPKTARVVGLGIVTLAQHSGRPIYPIAVVTNRRFDFRSWDRASLAKPFGRGAMVLGEPICVSRNASLDELETARLAVETGLNRVHARAYELVGSQDPSEKRVRGSAR
jgi:lysophospholipid acyltransferase (LPLAT)-like uncharacterized protein